MMSNRAMVEVAERLLEDEWASARGNRGSACTAPPLAHLLPQMIALLEQSHFHSIQDLAPTVSELIAEAEFDDIESYHGYSTSVDDTGCIVLDPEVQLYLRVLERLRCETSYSGQWSDLPVTPQMCG